MKRVKRVGLVLMLSACNTPPPPNTCTPPTGWEGRWQGTLVNLPARANAKPVEVTLEVGPMPQADNTCSPWRKTFVEAGGTPLVKDYQLCRGQGPEDWYVDEGNGVKLPGRWLGEVFLSHYKYDALVFFTSVRLRGDVVEDELLMADDKPVVPQGVQSLPAKLLQRVEFKRVVDCPK